jgi:ATP/maltotriose-dependent transcriptional regulator MalT
VEIDRQAGTARLMLPPPEILSARLDEKHTYVYRRTTGLLAERNEQLESKARQEALRAIEEAARNSDVMEKARRQAERYLQQLFEKFGVTRTTVGFRPA